MDFLLLHNYTDFIHRQPHPQGRRNIPEDQRYCGNFRLSGRQQGKGTGLSRQVYCINKTISYQNFIPFGRKGFFV